MKKIGLFLLSCMLVFVLGACSNNTDREVDSSENDKAADSQHQTDSQLDTQKDTQTETKQTIITFSTFYEDDLFKEAEEKYEAKHPNVDIELIYAHADGDDANWEANHEKFVKTTNTQILTGEGPDLMELGQLPVGQYVKQDALVNLSNMMDQDSTFQRDQYFTNILDNVKLDGGVYGIPLEFYLVGFIGDKEAIEQSGVPFNDQSWTWEHFIQISKEMAQGGEYQYAFSNYPEYLLYDMVRSRYTEFVDTVNRKAYFDSDAFIALMEQVKAMVDAGLVYTEGRGGSYFRSTRISSISDYVTDSRAYYDHTQYYNKPIPEGQEAGGYFQPSKIIGINASSSVKKEAWDFIKFLLSDEIHPGAFPLNKSVYKMQVEQLLQIGKVKAHELGALRGKEFEVSEKDFQGLASHLAGAIHHVTFKPTLIQEFIIEESKVFFAGQKSAEAVAQLIQNKATTYLNE